MTNRQCQVCGGYELDDGVSDLCFCDEDNIVECLNECGEYVRLGGFCSMKCKKEYDDYMNEPEGAE